MDIKKVQEAYDKCIRLLHKQRKTIPYKELDTCLYIVDKYLRWMKED